MSAGYDDRDDDYEDDEPRRRLTPHRGGLILALGIISLMSCPPVGIAAWMMGKKDLAEMKAGRMDSSGRDLTNIGYIVGIVATALFAFQIIIMIVVFGFMILGAAAAGPGPGGR